MKGTVTESTQQSWGSGTEVPEHRGQHVVEEAMGLVIRGHDVPLLEGSPGGRSEREGVRPIRGGGRGSHTKGEGVGGGL